MFDSPWHWAVVAIVAFVLFFGWKQLPEMSRSLGRSLRILKTEVKGMAEDDHARAETSAAKAIEPQVEHVVAPAAVAPAAVVQRPVARPVARPAAVAATSQVPASAVGSRPRPSPRPGAGS